MNGIRRVAKKGRDGIAVAKPRVDGTRFRPALSASDARLIRDELMRVKLEENWTLERIGKVFGLSKGQVSKRLAKRQRLDVETARRERERIA